MPLIDEWQTAPAVWNHIRREVDERGRLRMRPMSLFEAGRSTGAVSLAALLGGEPPRCPDPGLAVADLAELACLGGWPGLQGLGRAAALRAVGDYLEEVRRTDIGKADGRRRDPAKVGRFLRALARNTATYASAPTLATDAGGGDGPLKGHTALAYLAALERLMVVEDLDAWAPHLRSRSRVRGAAKRHFVDPSLAAAALGASPERLLEDLNLLGFLFESLVVRDLRVYAQALGWKALQYRDNTGLEVDAVLEAADGRWAAFEVKLGAGQVEEAAANLLRFSQRVDTAKCGKPGALGVIVGSGYGYARADGVSVIPIGALGP